VPPDSAAARFATYREAEDVRQAAVGLAWWMAHGDSAAILGMKWRADSLARAGANADARDAGRDISRLSEVALALARLDTAAALRRLAAFPGHFEPNDHWRGVLKGRLLAAQGRDREAATLLAWNLDPWPSHTFGWLAQARVAERLGDRATAVKAYRYVADIWREADPELQPYATEARQALARLGTAPAR
jgi:predicted Zn-dependent protease